jgi:hypothetical protein
MNIATVATFAGTLKNSGGKTKREADLEKQLDQAKADYAKTMSTRIANEIIASREKAAGGI